MTITSGIIFFTIFTVCAEVHIVFAETGDCIVNIGSFGACFKDESSGGMWQDRLIELTPAVNGSTTTCQNYRVNQVETRSCNESTDTLTGAYTRTTCNDTSWFCCANGRRISTALKCNGDDDCGDASDEYPVVNTKTYNCTNMGQYICGVPVKSSSGTTPSRSDRYFLGVPGLENFAAGFDLLTGIRRGNVLSMRPLGSCRRILRHGEGDYYYRLPNNVNSLSQTFSIEHVSGKIASTAAAVLTSNRDELELAYSFGGYLNSIDSAVGLSQSEIVKSFTLGSIETQNRFLAVTTTSRMKVFKVELRSPKNLEASNSFLERLYSLPRKSMSYESYLSFIQDFGTHYFSSGVLGGQYSMTNFYDRCWIDSELEQNFDMERSEWEERLMYCNRQSIKNKMNPNYAIPSSCTPGASQSSTGTDIVSEAVTSVVEIEGGSVSTSSSLRDSVTSDTWKEWATSVQDTPALLMDDFELTRISKLLDYPIPTMSNTERLQVQTLLDDAISIYLRPYDATTFCNCTDDCSEDSNGGATAAYLTGTAGKEYFCRCACDNSPRIVDCNRTTTNYISYVTMLLCLLISISLASDSKTTRGR